MVMVTMTLLIRYSPMKLVRGLKLITSIRFVVTGKGHSGGKERWIRAFFKYDHPGRGLPAGIIFVFWCNFLPKIHYFERQWTTCALWLMNEPSHPSTHHQQVCFRQKTQTINASSVYCTSVVTMSTCASRQPRDAQYNQCQSNQIQLENIDQTVCRNF